MRAASLVLALALAGCGGGPDGDALRKDVSARLAAALPQGEVSVASFARRGSQADTKAPGGETRRIVYFDAELKLEKDFDFGAWDGPGVAGLVSALGAGPKGVSGLTSGGNKAGDRLLVRGTARYKREGDAWVPVAAAGFRPSVAPAYATSEASFANTVSAWPSGASAKMRPPEVSVANVVPIRPMAMSLQIAGPSVGKS